MWIANHHALVKTLGVRMRMMPHAMPCRVSELKKDYGWIEHESQHNLYLACEDSSQRAFFFCTFSRSLLAFLASFLHWLRCFLFLSVANVSCVQHSMRRTSRAVLRILHYQEALFFPVLNLHRQCMWRMSTWACTWVQMSANWHFWAWQTRTYVCTYIARIDPSFKALC